MWGGSVKLVYTMEYSVQIKLELQGVPGNMTVGE